MMGSSALVEQESETAMHARVELLQRELLRKQSEIDSFRALSAENKYLREKLMALQDRVHLLTANWTEPATGDGISLRAQLLVYQRHSRVLQDELDRKEESIAELRGQVEQAEDELVASKRRCGILFERLCAVGAVSPANNNEEAVNGGMLGSGVMDEDDPTSFFSLVRKLHGVEMERDLLQEKFLSLQEDHERRGVLVTSMRRENAALRASVSKLIRHVQLGSAMENGTTVPPTTAVEGRDDVAVDARRKLLAYHAQKEVKRTEATPSDAQGG
ncbi:uncharacterized protein Tco025E_02198 [Trypanosoma conorhini]|uniref:Uncharacterized protein n=1 Tax=Trypanosoma conorhini TaxID=83891 RepID=A0A3R7PV50_9TRYP|nr:uncharacterized protein Tco025E_02198 [Trypanosoma conorhini]RNF25638.1 hypothetical protein Tco025E_02198 [Trypanosoma conorhini]